jgi:hypothetical protein
MATVPGGPQYTAGRSFDEAKSGEVEVEREE